MVDAFRTHPVVAVTAGHGEARGYAFVQLLIHDPRFVAAINDIVIEEGSSRYQDVADRFVRGENVPMSELRHVWRDTTQPGLGLDRPWEEFFTDPARHQRDAAGGAQGPRPARRSADRVGERQDAARAPAMDRDARHVSRGSDPARGDRQGAARAADLRTDALPAEEHQRQLRVGGAGGDDRQPAREQMGREGVHDLHGRRRVAPARRRVVADAEPRARSRHGARRRRLHGLLPVARRWAAFAIKDGKPDFAGADSARAVEDAARRGSVRRRAVPRSRGRRRWSSSIRRAAPTRPRSRSTCGARGVSGCRRRKRSG